MRLRVAAVLLLAGLGCERGRMMHLEHPIGIITIGDVFTEIIPSGVEPPHVFSDTFANGEDGQTAIEITLGQKDPAGIEKIASVVIDNLPPRPRGTLRVTVTATVSIGKQLTLKATVAETGYVREYGPFPVR